MLAKWQELPLWTPFQYVERADRPSDIVFVHTQLGDSTAFWEISRQDGDWVLQDIRTTYIEDNEFYDAAHRIVVARLFEANYG